LDVSQSSRQLIFLRFDSHLLGLSEISAVLLFQFLELCVDLLFFGEELVSPNVGLKDRVQSSGVVSNDLESRRS
jgi:hypothetical protein